VFPRIYSDVLCPLDGYDLTISVLANPTSDEKRAWWSANLGDPACAACVALRQAHEELPARDLWCAACTAARHAFGASVQTIFTAIGDLDLSTPAACVSAIEGQIPDELMTWLYQAPSLLWSARSEDIKKKLLSFLATGDSTPSLDETTPMAPSTATWRR
jgi:hypothetical protein